MISSTPNLNDNKLSYNNNNINWSISKKTSYIKLTDTESEYTFKPKDDIKCKIFMIGGGGSGNIVGGGGGGAGGAYIDNNFTFKKDLTYKLKVGTGGSMIMNNNLVLEKKYGLNFKKYNVSINNANCEDNVSFNIDDTLDKNILDKAINITNFSSIEKASRDLIKKKVNKHQVVEWIDESSNTAEWKGYLNIPSGKSGNYQFKIETSSIAYLWIDIDNTSTVFNPTINNAKCGVSLCKLAINKTSDNLFLKENIYYPIRIVFSETNTQNLNFNLSFKGPATNDKFISDFSTYVYESSPNILYKYNKSTSTYLNEFSTDTSTEPSNHIICNGGDNGNIINICLSKKPWAMYFAEDFAGTNLPDRSGNNNNATTFGTIKKATENNISYISGSKSDGINFPSNSIPNKYTICSIIKYNGVNKNNIFKGKQADFVLTATKDNKWTTVSIKNDPNNEDNNFIINGTIQKKINISGNDTLIINDSSSKTSDWALICLFIWNTNLTNIELQYMDIIMNEYLNGGFPIKERFTNNDSNNGGKSGNVISTYSTQGLKDNKGGDGNNVPSKAIMPNFLEKATYKETNIIKTEPETISNNINTNQAINPTKFECEDYVSSIQYQIDNNSIISNNKYYTSLGFKCRNGKVFKPFGSSDKIQNGLRLTIYDTSKNTINDIIKSLQANSNSPIKEVYSSDYITDYSSITKALNNSLKTDFNKYLYNWYGTLIVPKTDNYKFVLRSQDTQSYLWIGDNALNPSTTNYSLEDHYGTIPWIPPYSYPQQSCSSVPVTTYTPASTVTGTRQTYALCVIC